MNRVPVRYRNPQITEETDLEAYEDIHNWLVKPQLNLLLLGAPGRGKTYATYYLIRELMKRTHNDPRLDIRFFRSSDADQRMIEEVRENGTNRCFIHMLSDVRFLFLDDFGVESSSERMERNYYDLLDQRLSKEYPTVISTNVPLNKFEDLFGSRIASRLQEYVTVRFNKGDLRNV